jgi:hypothetical protein
MYKTISHEISVLKQTKEIKLVRLLGHGSIDPTVVEADDK